MTLSRAAPGPQLSVGRLRVDAARAITKLREYQLADRTSWVLEAIRAAVASDATQIELRGDANDVWLSWEGSPWPAEDLPRLFDELVSPEPTSERHHLRLLAAAVNSALGMNPAYIDVFAIGPDGAMRARYTPDVLVETAELEDSALRKVAAEPATPPAGIAPSAGMLVHLRRRSSLGMLSYLFWEREPPELAVARAACRDIAVPLRIGRTVYDRKHHDRDVSRLELGDGLDGFVALVDPTAPRSPDHAAIMEVAERGVVLATYAIALGPAAPKAPVPIRLFIDAPRMPTNASRSQVRRESHPIAAAEQRAPALVAKLLAALATELGHGVAPARAGEPTSSPAQPAGEATPERSARTRECALALLAAHLGGADWASNATWAATTIGPPGQVRLVRDATGAPQPVARPWSGLVYTDREPMPVELAPWVGDVLWIRPGDPTARLVDGANLDARAMRRHAKWARRQHKAHRKFFQHAPRAPKVTTRDRPRLRAQLGAKLAGSCVPEPMLGGLSGEVCLHPQRTGGELVLLFQGREIERVRIECPIGFEAVIDSAVLKPGDRYRGVARDAEFSRAELAARAGVLRAVEALALDLDGGEPPDGFETGETRGLDVDARIVRDGLALALELGVPIQAPLETAKVWRGGEDGAWVSLAELRKRTVIGVVTPGTTVSVPRRRIVIDGGSSTQELLGKLAPGLQIVRYDLFRASGADPQRMAARLATPHACVLEVRGDGVVGVIAPATVSSIQLHHMGAELDGRSYTPKLLAGCKILVDCDAIVPDADWRTALDDGGMASRDFLPWELQLVRAAARAFVGDRPPELHGGSTAELDTDLGRMLCHALTRGDAKAVLGPELVAKLCARPLVRVLGRAMAISIDELATLFPDELPYVDRAAMPVEDFSPLVADELTARAVAGLVGRQAVDGKPDLELRRRLQLRKTRLAAHRAITPQPLAYPMPGVHVALDPASDPLAASGFVGVGHGRLEVQVWIEGRPFQAIYRADDLPLHAVVELQLRHANATFDGLSELVVEQLVTAVRRAAAPLLVAIAKLSPHVLADLGATRTLLAGWATRGPIDGATRTALVGAPALPTLQGTRVSIEDAAHPLNVISIATWHGEWLATGEGEELSAFDHHVVKVPETEGELQSILEHLHQGSIVDVTDEVAKLQGQRRMARGLIPAPALPHVPGELKRRLAELGDVGKQLGHGEIGLVEGGVSSALLHERGEPRQRISLDVLPAIHLAIEADLVDGPSLPAPPARDIGDMITEQLRALRDPEFARGAGAPTTLDGQAQELAIRLARAILGLPHDALSSGIRRSLRRAVLAKRLEGTEVLGALLFETNDGEWIDWQTVLRQIASFGDVWAVPARTEDRPLAAQRIVLVLGADELGIARGSFSIIDATRELALDATARRNRARPPAHTLALHSHDGVLAEVELDGDGVTAPRGVVGVLAPAAVDRRGLYAHREMHPFDRVDDPCRWPTVAVLDDARLQPDRTWTAPLMSGTGAWADVAGRVRAASERALASLIERPDDAFEVEWVGPTTQAEVASLRGSKTQVRGALWLAGAPRRLQSIGIEVVDTYGKRSFSPEHGLAMGGSLYVHAPDGWLRDQTLEDLCAVVHAKLVRGLIRRTDLDGDLVASHVAHALALDRILTIDASELRFDCFRPAPLDANALSALLRGREAVQVVGLGDDPDLAGVIEDGSELARVVIAWLGERARRGRPEQPRPRPPEPRPELTMPRPAPKPAPVHPLQILVDVVHARLVDLGVPTPGCEIGDFDEPILHFQDGLRFAGASHRLLAIANAMRAKSPWAPMAIDAVIAHAITVLNVALTDITDATETHVLEALLVGA